MSASHKNSNHQVHVCLISGQPIPNLLPLLHERPGKALFIVTPEMQDQAVRLEKVVRRYGITVTVLRIDSAYDYRAIVDTCEKLLAEPGKEELVLNVTGGTKITALAAFQAFFFSRNSSRIIYCDTEHDRLLQLAPENSESPLVQDLITVNDYLACYGLPKSNGGNPPAGAEKRRSRVSSLATLLVHNESLLSKLNSALTSSGPKKQFANIHLNVRGKEGEELAGLLEHCGVAERTQSHNIHIPTEESLFFCRGGWLEEFVYWSVKNLAVKGLDLAMNVKVQWDGTGRKPTKNEFDVLFTHRNRLHCISCKASNPERKTASGTRATEALNELDSLADRAGGLFGKTMLVSSRRLSEFDRSRAEKMKICLVDGQEVLRLPQHLGSWLKLL